MRPGLCLGPPTGGKLQSSSRPVAGFQGAAGERERGGRSKRRKREGESVPPLFLQFNHC